MTGHWSRFFLILSGFSLLTIFNFCTPMSPPSKVCISPQRAAHYPNLSLAFGWLTVRKFGLVCNFLYIHTDSDVHSTALVIDYQPETCSIVKVVSSSLWSTNICLMWSSCPSVHDLLSATISQIFMKFHVRVLFTKSSKAEWVT